MSWYDEDRRRDPRPVKEGLEALARRLGVPSTDSLGVIFSRWDDTVGDALASHTKPVSLTDGILVVAVDQPGWATQLRYLAPQLIGRLNEACGESVVGRVEIRVRGR